MIFSRFYCITALFLLMLPAASQAQFNYITNGDSIAITGYTGPGGAVVIPDSINGYSVTSIAINAFNGNTSLTGITIPGSVTTIQGAAFSYCTNLTSAVLSGSLISIGNDAFSNCSSLTDISIPNTVTTIGFAAFNGCASLSSVSIPNSVTNIGIGVFSYCVSMTNISVDVGNPDYSSVNGVLFDEAQDTLLEYPTALANSAYTIPGGVTTIEQFAFGACTSLASITIPDSVTNIIDPQFNDCAKLTNICVSAANPAYSSLNGVLLDKSQDTLLQYPPGLTNSTYDIPNSVTTIGNNAFSSCTNLVSVTIPGSVNNIGENAFLACFSLASITIPNGVTNISDEAFGVCTSLTSVVIPDSVTSIGSLAFQDCTSLTGITIPGSVATIGEFAFAYSSGLVSAYFQGNAPADFGQAFTDDPVTIYYQPGTTGWGATFDGVPTVEETEPDDFTYITNSDAISISITGYTGSNGTVVIPDIINGYYVTSLGMNAFLQDTSLTNVTIPNSVTSIGDGAFQSCINLGSITIPNRVTNIGASAFDYCLSMTNVFVESGDPDYTSLNGVLFDKAQDTLIEAPSGLTNNAYAIPSGVVTIEEDAFDSCRNVTSFTLPGSLTNIVGPPFNDCTGLTNISVNATNPAYCALNGVLFDKARDTLVQYPPGLANPTYNIPNSVTTIQGDSFSFCANLVSITIPNSVTSIGWGAFLGCTSLNSIVIPNGVANIPDAAFQSCTSLSSIIIPNSVTNIGWQAFSECSNLTNVIIPTSVTTISDFAFAGSSGLASAYFEGNSPPGNPTIFYNDPATVYYLPGTTGWGATFGNVPTQFWFQSQPQVLSFEPSFGVQNNQFGFTISWATNASVIVQACTNLSNPIWIPVATNSLFSGTNYFSDPSSEDYPGRFYRITSE